MNAEQVVTSIWPESHAHRFQIGGSEVYAYPDIDAYGCWLLGSGVSLWHDGRMGGEEWIDYTVTEEAAWEHAAYFVTLALKWVKHARKKGMFSSEGITVHKSRFNTSRFLFRRTYTINHNPVSKLEFLQQLGLHFKWDADEEE